MKCPGKLNRNGTKIAAPDRCLCVRGKFASFFRGRSSRGVSKGANGGESGFGAKQLQRNPLGCQHTPTPLQKNIKFSTTV